MTEPRPPRLSEREKDTMRRDYDAMLVTISKQPGVRTVDGTIAFDRDGPRVASGRVRVSREK